MSRHWFRNTFTQWRWTRSAVPLCERFLLATTIVRFIVLVRTAAMKWDAATITYSRSRISRRLRRRLNGLDRVTVGSRDKKPPAFLYHGMSFRPQQLRYAFNSARVFWIQ